jgi:ubiquinone/menaquinone biosynthesis C-methylase UbiE
VEAGRTFLDIGCGTGHLLRAADKRGLETYGTDISDEAVKIVKKTSPNSSVLVGKGEDLQFEDNYFDYLTCIGAFEHFLDMEKGLSEMLRVTKDSARLCLVVPNSNYLFWKLKGEKGTDQQDINEHLMSLKEWREMFEKAGLEIENTYQDLWFKKSIKIFSDLNLLKITKRFIQKYKWLFLPLNFTYQFIFIMKKKNMTT